MLAETAPAARAKTPREATAVVDWEWGSPAALGGAKPTTIPTGAEKNNQEPALYTQRELANSRSTADVQQQIFDS
jgi:hypothetical protein